MGQASEEGRVLLHFQQKKNRNKYFLQVADMGKEGVAQAGKMLTKGIGGFAGKAFGSFF